jgi:hypothetical protein
MLNAKKRNEIIKNITTIYNNTSIDKVRNAIENHFIPTKEELKIFGEVSTPNILIEQMLNKIPNNYWNNINTTFEPCCGKGNIVLAIFDKLFTGLEKLFPDPNERCKNIITKCIYFCDITLINIFITSELLKCHINKLGCIVDYNFNTHTGNTLDLNIKKKWNINGFDAIIGNPPYNSGNIGTGNSVWQHFVTNSLENWLNKNGYLCFVHPSGWRKPCYEKSQLKKLYDLMVRKNQMLYLEIHGSKDGKKTFKKGTRYDWYVIKKNNNNKIKTIIIDEKYNKIELDLSELKWLPNYDINNVLKIIANNHEKKLDILMNSSYHATRDHMSSTKNSTYKYPCIHSTPKSGTRYKYSKINNKGHFKIPKIIFGESGINNSIIDFTGEYGMTQGAMAILSNDIEELKNIKTAIESNKFQNIIRSCIFGNFRIDCNIFKDIKQNFWKDL